MPTPISTYDGSGQALHPDVLDLGRSFSSFRYWMAMTPYPFGNDRLENPSLRVSVDGAQWEKLPGAPDPLVPTPRNWEYHNADADLAFDGHRLFLYYLTRSRVRPHATVSVISTENGIEWSQPLSILDQAWGVSPAVIRFRGSWNLYYVHADLKSGPESFQLRRLSGPTPEGFSAESECTLEISGHHIWHVDMIAYDGGVECLVAAFPHGSDPSRCRLFHARSPDGLRFDCSNPAPLLRPSWFSWDCRMIYRSTFLRDAKGTYTVWYSAASWGMACGIGTLVGPLDALRPARGNPGPVWRGLIPYRRDALALAKHAILVALPRSFLVRVRPSLRNVSELEP